MTISYELDNNLYLNITNRCTNACDFCVRNNEDGIDKDLDLWLKEEPTLAEIIQDLEARDFSKYGAFVFCGYGEPTMRLDIILAVGAWVKDKTDIPVRLNTNGHANLIYGKDVTGDLAKVIDTVSISLNTDTASKYQALCHSDFGEASFDALIDFAKKCKANGIDTCLSVVDVISPEEIENCQRIADDAGIRLRVRAYIK